jgi:hypothetical protein
LWIKLVDVYIVSSISMSAYGMCKASMSNFTIFRMTRIKQKWMAIWKHNFKKWIPGANILLCCYRNLIFFTM